MEKTKSNIWSILANIQVKSNIGSTLKKPKSTAILDRYWKTFRSNSILNRYWKKSRSNSILDWYRNNSCFHKCDVHYNTYAIKLLDRHRGELGKLVRLHVKLPGVSMGIPRMTYWFIAIGGIYWIHSSREEEWMIIDVTTSICRNWSYIFKWNW